MVFNGLVMWQTKRTHSEWQGIPCQSGMASGSLKGFIGNWEVVKSSVFRPVRFSSLVITNQPYPKKIIIKKFNFRKKILSKVFGTRWSIS